MNSYILGRVCPLHSHQAPGVDEECCPWPPFVLGSGENVARTLWLIRWAWGRSTGLSKDGGPDKTDTRSATCGCVTVGKSVNLSEFPFPHLQVPSCRAPGTRKHLLHCRCPSNQSCYKLLAVLLWVWALAWGSSCHGLCPVSPAIV